MRPLYLLLIACLLFAPVAELRAQQALPQGEYVIVAGGVSLMMWEKYKRQPHDNWWLNFIRASRIRIAEIRSQYPDMPVTLMVYAPAYKRRQAYQSEGDLFGIIRSVPAAYNVKLVLFSQQSELINYLNNRSAGRLSGFEYFGHSNKACFLFDYSNEIGSASKVWLHERELNKLNRGIFANGAYVKSWGCHTGESMSQKFKAATGVKMIGAAGKTQYMTETLPVISTAGGHWVGQ
ncbi:MAG TPA: hypothetical protein VF585_00720 [Chthoniobacterales bacterium]|jgi:hypothetical protein